MLVGKIKTRGATRSQSRTTNVAEMSPSPWIYVCSDITVEQDDDIKSKLEFYSRLSIPQLYGSHCSFHKHEHFQNLVNLIYADRKKNFISAFPNKNLKFNLWFSG